MISLPNQSKPAPLQLYKRPRLSQDSSSDVYSNVKKTAETLMMQQASWKTECQIMSKRLDDAKAVIQEQQKRIVSLSEVIGKLNGTVSEQMKALDRFKFIAIEAETLHGATKEQLSKALLELEEGKRDSEKMSSIINERHEEFLSLRSESESLRQERDHTQKLLREETNLLDSERRSHKELQEIFKCKEKELCEVTSAKDCLSEKYLSLEHQNKEEMATVEILQGSISALRSDLEQKENTTQEMKKQIETEVESHLKVVNYMEEQLSQQKIENESLCEKISKLQIDLSDKEGKLEDLTSQICTSEDILEETKSKLEGSVSREAQLKVTNEELVLKLQETTVSYQQISTDCATLLKLNEEIKAASQQHQQRITNLGAEQEQLIVEWKGKLSASEAQYATLDREHRELRIEQEKAVEEMAAMENDMQQLAIELDASERSTANRESIVKQQEEQMDLFETQYKSLSETAQKREVAIAELTSANDHLCGELKERERERELCEQEFKERIEELEEKNSSLQEKNRALDQHFKDTNSDLKSKM